MKFTHYDHLQAMRKAENIEAAKQEERSRCIMMVDDEPELPGDIPDKIWDIIKNDRKATEEALRAAVRLTKDGIKKRILE